MLSLSLDRFTAESPNKIIDPMNVLRHSPAYKISPHCERLMLSVLILIAEGGSRANRIMRFPGVTDQYGLRVVAGLL